MLKNKLNKYIFFEVIKSYFFVLIALSLLIWIIQAAKYLSIITDSGLSIKIYLNYVILLFPKNISQLSIISFLISLFLTILKLQENKELEIFWFAGISKIKLSKLIFLISLLPTLLTLLLQIYIVPFANFEGRKILINSEFSMINSLVKMKNFNSPLKNVTIFVNKNDNKGNLEKVFIFEKNKTILSQTGRILNINKKNYLELINGFIHEKKNDNSIEVVQFDKTLFDFTKYNTSVTKYTKIQERDTAWLIDQYLKKKNNYDIKEEIHKRVFKPLFIPIISILCCFLFFANNEKIKLLKLKIFIFFVSVLFIIFLEILINLSVKYIIFQYILYLFPFLGAYFLFLYLKFFLKTEPMPI